MKSPPAVRFQQLAKAMKHDQFFQSRGMTADQVNSCLANVDAIQKLADSTSDATQQYNVQGTPTFLTNAQVPHAHPTWPPLTDPPPTTYPPCPSPPPPQRGYLPHPLPPP